MIRNNWISYVWRSAFVLVSAVVFGVCLTQTAFVSPGAYFDHGYELPLDSMENSAWSQLCFGWLGLPAAVVSLFMPYAFPIVPIVVAVVLFAKEWDIAAAMAALVAVGSMWINHTLALAAWLANPLLAAAWLLLLLNKRRGALFCAAMALGLMVGFLSLDKVPFGLKTAWVPITAYGVGYWLWVTSAGIVVSGVSIERILCWVAARKHSALDCA